MRMTDTNADARAWLLLGISALGISTLFALLLILARAPLPIDLPLLVKLFPRALVVHVDLATLVWVLSAAAMLWSGELGVARDSPGTPWRVALLGVSLITVAPLLPFGEVWMLDYVPLLASVPFIAGLLLFLAAIATTAFRRLWAGVGNLAVWLTALGVLLALACFPIALLSGGDPQSWVWGGGHALQLAFALLLAAAWLELAEMKARTRIVSMLLLAGILPLVVAPLLYLLPLDAQGDAFTMLMVTGGWLPAFPLAVWLLLRGSGLVRLAAVLYLSGLAVGVMIRDNSAMVPAHYHGMVGAVTISMMALVWQRLPRFGGSLVGAGRIRIQQRLYGWGTLLLLIGLAVSGASGAARKIAGAAFADSGQLLGGILMALGGVAAISGAVMFVWVVLAAMWGAGRVGFHSVGVTKS